jgi:drug/metabolite transporter (DMT)-like permease
MTKISDLLKNKNSLAIVTLCIANLIWGSTFVVVKESVTYVDTFIISFVRCGIAAFVLGIYILIKRPQILLEINSLKYGFILGLILATIYCSQAYALEYTTSSHSAFITVSSTILTPVVLVLFYKSREHWKGWISIVVVFVGIYLLTYKNSSNTSSAGQVYGDFITLLAAIVCAFQLIYSGKFVRKSDFLSLIFYQFLFGALLSSIGILLKPSATFDFPSNSIYYIGYLGLFGTLYCYFVTVWAQKYVSTITTAMIFSMEPIFASTFSYLHFGEVFGLKELAGALLILTGVIAYQLKSKWLIKYS